jgi:hypothetical protein
MTGCLASKVRNTNCEVMETFRALTWTSEEIKFMRRTAGYIWSDFKQNTEILEKLKVTPFIQDKISNYETDWRDHVNRMSRSRLPKLITQLIPKGRRDRARPMKKLTDSEAGTGQHWPTS